MVKEALEVVKNRIAIKIVYIPISYPVESEQQIIESFESELAKHGGAESGGVKLCIFDHVSSMVLFPVLCCSKLCCSPTLAIIYMVLLAARHCDAG